MTTTPFFPLWRARLASLGRKTTHSLRQSTLGQFRESLSRFIPPALLVAQEEGPNSRERVFPLGLTFQCFIWQMLNPHTSCREVVRHVQTLLRLAGLMPIDDSDSAYVQARQRFPRQRLEKALHQTAQAADRRVGKGGRLAGRPVKVVDGSTTQLPDTKKNQKRYPQPSAQKPGCGFPVMKFVVLFSLASGAVGNVIMGNLHNHELHLFRRLWDQLKTGDIILGDRAWGEFTTLAVLPRRRQVDVVARLHGARKCDFRKAQRLGKNDGLFTWTKSQQPSAILTLRQWRALPEQITVRVIRFTAASRGFCSRSITLVTTLVDPKLYPADQLKALYARRWQLELCLRDLKTTMGMEQLRCKSPAMAQKEMLAYLVAHNLIRCLMAEAISRYDAQLERISFKGTVDALRQYSAAVAQARTRKMRDQLWEDLLLNLARDLVPLRPNRCEPRALKRRPKPYSLLTKPRHLYKEIPHRARYRKNKGAEKSNA